MTQQNELQKLCAESLSDEQRAFRRVLIVGGGMMGKDIAFAVSALEGCAVTVWDTRPVDLAAGIRASTVQLVEKGILTAEGLERRLARIRFTQELDSTGAEEAEIVIEAVYEDMALKQEVFAVLEARCRRSCIFCTNTSAMSPSEISRKLQYQDRFCGTHFWNPAHLIPLVEVVKTDATTDEAVAAVMAFMTRIGKKPCLCRKDVPGFIANRLQHALWREAFSIVEQGIADAATVDAAVKNSFGLRLPQLGPMENADMVGNDMALSIHRYVLQHLEDSHAPSSLLVELNETNRLGFKTDGEGWQSWTQEEMAASRDALNAYLIRMLYGV